MKSIIVIFCSVLLTGCIHTRETRVVQTEEITELRNRICKLEKRELQRIYPNDNSIYVTGVSLNRDMAYDVARHNLKRVVGADEVHKYILSEHYSCSHKDKHGNVRIEVKYKAIKK